jgi:MoaA/NifB/PqqE/SkfB family radical SAM enzyme
LLDRLPKDKKYDFVISGGEPLLYWSLTERLICEIKRKFSQSEITIQTNMFFLDSKKIRFFKEKDIIIEPGIDGDFFSNFRHRIGITKSSFQKCLKNINLIVKYNLRMNPTMTVHPQEVKFMFVNFKKLISLGLNSIEIHPAFLANWRKKQVKEFIRQYKKILEYEKNTHRYLVCKEYSFYIKNLSLDLVIQPDGFILPNWTYLSFPYKLRKLFFIGKLSDNGLIILKNHLRKYLEKLKRLTKIKITYRDFSNFNALFILKYIEDVKLKRNFLIYKDLCEKIQRIELVFNKNKFIQ